MKTNKGCVKVSLAAPRNESLSVSPTLLPTACTKPTRVSALFFGLSDVGFGVILRLAGQPLGEEKKGHTKKDTQPRHLPSIIRPPKCPRVPEASAEHPFPPKLFSKSFLTRV